MNPVAQDRKKVMIVDDEIPLTRLLKLNLEDDGQYEVLVENHAMLAHQAARRFKPDIIFMDVMMPDGDGGDVAAEMEKDPALRDTPITFMTAAVRKAELGADEGIIGGKNFIAKPVNLDQLIDHIRRRTG